MSACAQSLRERGAGDASAERDFVELEGAIDSAFHVARELIGEDARQSGSASVADINGLLCNSKACLEAYSANTSGSSCDSTRLSRWSKQKPCNWNGCS